MCIYVSPPLQLNTLCNSLRVKAVMISRCQCGDSVVELGKAQPIGLYACYCSECQLQSGSAHGLSAIYDIIPDLKVDGLSHWQRRTKSGLIQNVYFCKTCGSRLVVTTDKGEYISVKGGTMRHEEGEDPIDWSNVHHIWISDKLPTWKLADGILSSPESP